MIFLLILSLFLFAKPSFAATTTVNITDYPTTNVVVGDSFPVTFTVTSLNVGTTYHYKIVGDNGTDISTLPNSTCANNYETCSNIIISDTGPVTAIAFTKINVLGATNNIKIRIAQSDDHSKTYDSSFVNILSIAPTPTLTPTLTATPTPTNVPTPSSTPTPTPTVTLTPTHIPTPTRTPTSTPTPNLNRYDPSESSASAQAINEPLPTDEPIPTPTSEAVLGDSTSVDLLLNPSPTPPKSSSKNIIPGLFIGFGGLLLLTPLVVVKIKSLKSKIN